MLLLETSRQTSDPITNHTVCKNQATIRNINAHMHLEHHFYTEECNS